MLIKNKIKDTLVTQLMRKRRKEAQSMAVADANSSCIQERLSYKSHCNYTPDPEPSCHGSSTRGHC